ncbi:hypothetical protein BDQ17DRAFT_1544663 [Cyathus striatus]|nr:hypothetical protein BDQ17DRAFT_1544663 [Cyathus striatus]
MKNYMKIKQARKKQPTALAISNPKSVSDARIVAYEFDTSEEFDPENPPTVSKLGQLLCTAITEPVFLPSEPQPLSNALICTRIPKAKDDKGNTQCILFARTKECLLNIRHYGRQPPELERTWAAYHITKQGVVSGSGMLARRVLHVGDLILVERPLIVVPFNVRSWYKWFSVVCFKSYIERSKGNR